MADFSLTITAPNRDEKLAGIAWARETINAGVPPEAQFATDADYIEHVLNMAAESYAKAGGFLERAP
ncbi:MAG: hypothetical protein HYX38_35195 [Rhodospirillales bacterium]|nr:hypothetical protein [Rhodospirillales bacterium]